HSRAHRYILTTNTHTQPCNGFDDPSWSSYQSRLTLAANVIARLVRLHGHLGPDSLVGWAFQDLVELAHALLRKRRVTAAQAKAGGSESAMDFSYFLISMMGCCCTHGWLRRSVPRLIVLPSS